MTRKRTIATIAALGGLTAAVALMSGAPVAKADELSELRANQELLQRRVDQLAAAATAAPTAPGTPTIAGSFPRSFLIPGTDTSILIGGFVRLTMDWALSGNANGIANNTIVENGFLLGAPLDTAGKCIPYCGAPGGVVLAPNLAHSHDNGVQFTPRETRLRIETRTPTSWGPAGTVLEFDFAGGTTATQHVPNSIQPRLRLAYGTLGPWLAGQAYSNFNDLQSHSTTLDFGGDVGDSATVRPPQVRYTLPLPAWGATFAVAAESPDTGVVTAGGNFDKDSATAGAAGLAVNPAKNTLLPDGTFNLTFHQPWGHLSIRAVVEDLDFQDGRFISREFIGYGGAVSGSIKPAWLGWSKDVITWGASGGPGIGRYTNGSDSFSLVSNYGKAGLAIAGGAYTQAAANNVIVKPVMAYQGHIGYEHWWTAHVRSDFSVGVQYKDYNSLLLGPGASANANKELFGSHVNLVWSPVSFVDAGLEWAYGHRVTTANLKGDVNFVIGSVTVKF